MPRPHRHVWHDDGFCKCGETHPVVEALRAELALGGQVEAMGYATDSEMMRYGFHSTRTGLYWPTDELPGDLLSAIEAPALTPQDRAKIVRRGFTARGWPNEEHPGSVRDFLETYGVPIA